MVTRTGTDVKNSMTPMVNGSIQVPCRSAAQIPAGIPTAKMIISASRLYWKVTQRRGKSTSFTGNPRGLSPSPKSPRTAPFM